jgi:hypothetical protein
MLVDTTHALPMYKNHKRYVQDIMMKETPKISPQELAVQLNLTLGEAFVLLYEIRGNDIVDTPRTTVESTKTTNRSLLDFGNQPFFTSSSCLSGYHGSKRERVDNSLIQNACKSRKSLILNQAAHLFLPRR